MTNTNHCPRCAELEARLAGFEKETFAELRKRVEGLENGLRHISETCIEDPDTAQFACRLLDGSASPPKTSELQEALRWALKEIDEHNREYKYVTGESAIHNAQKLLEKK